MARPPPIKGAMGTPATGTCDLVVLIRCLQSDDDRIAIMAAQAILDRGYGKPHQTNSIDITEDGPVRYYVELPKKAESTEAWLQSVTTTEDETTKSN